MNSFVLLLRGINVGGRNKLPMKDLKQWLQALGFEQVQTVIQSGNVVFQTSGSAQDIETQVLNTLAAKLDFQPGIHVLEKSQFLTLLDQPPFPTDDGKALHLYFLKEHPQQPNLDRINALKKDSESYHLEDTVFYMYAPEGIGRSKLAAQVEKALGVSTTARNWNTVQKLKALL